MKLFFDDRQCTHAPARELHNGDWTDFAETPARALAVKNHFTDWAEVTDHGLEPILAVHDADYVAFLQTAHDEWLAAGRSGDAIPYALPVIRRRPLDLTRIDAKLGAHAFDTATPISDGTWTAAYWSAQTALSGVDALAAGEGSAYALCRPPGHHCGADYMGGYCYLNTPAIAARAAAAQGLGPVAILDVDYHHGNGTQDIFYEDGSVLFCSIHADPKTDYPFFWGHADETGAGAGEGATANWPLPRGTTGETYMPALDAALARIREWGARCLIVSFGADTYDGDPISFFALTQDDYREMSRRIAAVDLPTLVVMEGGYAVDALGENVAAFLSGFGRD